MKTVKFGRKERQTSHLGFGGAPAGLKNYLDVYNPETDYEAVVEAVRHAFDRGITYFDTAPGYGNGASERIFGEGLAGVPRDAYVLATKCGANSYKDVIESVESSLKRLRTDRLDVVQFHGDSWKQEDADRILSPDGPLAALEYLRDQGVVDNIGFTSEDNNMAVYRFIASGRFDVAQLCYNLIFQHPYDPTRPYGSLMEAKKQGLSTVTMRATTSGIFQRFMKTIRPDDTFDYTPHLIHFALSNPYTDVVLVGMRSKHEVDANVALADLPPMDLDEIHRRYR